MPRTIHPSLPQLSVRCLHVDDRAVIKIAGEVDIATAPQFRAAIEQAIDGRRHLEVDLRDTTFMDGSGLAILLAAHQELGGHPEAVVIRSPTGAVRRLLDASGAEALFDVRVDGDGQT
jgi:anti-anti-sigma factor